MNPTTTKALHVALLVLTAIAALGPVVAPLVSVIPSTAYRDISECVAFAGTIVAYLTQSPLFAPLLQIRPIAGQLPKPPAVPRILGVLGLLAFVAAFAGCSLFKSGAATTVIADVGSLAGCVIHGLETDADPTVESLALECSPILASDVVAILAALEGPVVSDAGSTLPASFKAHKALVAHRAAK